MPDATVSAGRGVLYLGLAKLYFMIAGYTIYFTLPRLLGSEVSWGNYLLVIGLVSVIDNVIVTGTIQAVSKFTAQGDLEADAVKKAAIKVQLGLGCGVALLYFLAASTIAAWERDVGLTNLYRISAGIVMCYSFYAVFVGTLNGLRRFGSQAGLDVAFATIRAVFILGAAAMAFGVSGAIGGFVAAAALILAVSAWLVGLPRKAGAFEAKRLWTFMVQMFVYSSALNLVMRADLFLLKRYAGAFIEGAAAAKAATASAIAGYYGTAQSLALIPYQAILAVTFVVFPLISRSTFEQDLATTRAYIRQTLRLSSIFVVGLAVVLIANPDAVIGVPYPALYRVGGPALRILAAGIVCFSMFTIINTILNGAGHTRETILSALITLVLVVLANALFVPRASSEFVALEVAATATSASIALGLALSTWLLYRAYQAAFPWRSVLRIIVSGAVAVAVGTLIPEVSKLVTLAECAVVFACYVLALILLGEFDRADVARLTRVLGR